MAKDANYLVYYYLEFVNLNKYFSKSNYMITRVFEISNLVLLMMMSFLAFMPMLLGTILGATGCWDLALSAYMASYFLSILFSLV